jgi:hypothetical protein
VTADDDIPPEWVPWFELLRWVIWIARRCHALELDEASVKRLVPDVVLALRHKVDERKEPRLGLCDHGQFVGEIGWLVDYDVDWRTGRTQRVDHLEDDPPHLRDRTFTLAVAWDWLVAAVKQAVKLTRPAPAAKPAAAAANESQETASAEPKREWRPGDTRTLTKQVAQTLFDLHQNGEIDVTAHPSVYDMATKVMRKLHREARVPTATFTRGLRLAREVIATSC